MKKIYKFYLLDECDYDEYYAFVVIAKCLKEAKHYLSKKLANIGQDVNDFHHCIINPEKENGIICESFKAG